jgi:hypothetical protein
MQLGNSVVGNHPSIVLFGGTDRTEAPVAGDSTGGAVGKGFADAGQPLRRAWPRYLGPAEPDAQSEGPKRPSSKQSRLFFSPVVHSLRPDRPRHPRRQAAGPGEPAGPTRAAGSGDGLRSESVWADPPVPALRRLRPEAGDGGHRSSNWTPCPGTRKRLLSGSVGSA